MLPAGGLSRRHREAVLDDALGGAPMMLYALSADGAALTAITPNVAHVTGHAPERFLSAPHYGRDLIASEGDRSAYRAALETVRAQGAATVEYRLRHAEGREVWLRDELRLLQPAGQDAPVIVASSTDVTELKETRSLLHRADALRAAIIDSPLYSILAIDAAGRLIEFNAAAARLLGHARRDVIGRPMTELLVAPADRDEVDGLLRRFFAENRTAERLEIEAMRADGTVFPAELTVTGADIDGRRVAFGDLRDISAHRRTADERKHLLQLLHDAIEAVPDGFAIVDAAERLVLCNTAFADLYGQAPDHLVGRPLPEIHGRLVELTQRIDGQPVVNEAVWTALTLARTRRGSGRRTEAELKDGRTIALTSHLTSDGGLVLTRSDVTGQKRIERTLRESEQHFRLLVEAHPLPVWMVDLDSGRILYESPAAAVLFGHEWPSDEPHWVTEFYVDPAERARFVSQIRQTGEVRDFELLMKRRDGSRFWASVTSRLIPRPGPATVITGIVDLTERKAREAAMQEARDTLEDAIESLPEGFALYDAADRLVTCNGRYREFNAVSADVLKPGVLWPDFLRAGAERGQYRQAIGRVEEWLAERTAHPVGAGADYEIEQSDGRWFQISRQRTRRGGIAVIRTEITHLKRMQQALRESEERFRSIAEAHPVPVVITRREEGTILYASPAACQLWGKTQAELLGQDIRRYYANPSDREQIVEIFRREGRLDFYEVLFRKADGTPIPAGLTSRPVQYDGAEAMVSSIFDLTERKAAEQQIAQQREALYQSEKLNALGTLLAGVAHELNNPLSVVVGQALLLRETTSDPAIEKRARKIGDAADRCARIVRTFLAMARQQPPSHKEIQLHDVVDSALDIAGYALRSAEITVKKDLAAYLPPVWADPDQLNQVLINLILNAQQAMMEQPLPRRLKITTRYDAASGMVRLTVGDNGPGIPAELRSRIFEPFFTTKGQVGGTGMGLAVSRGIVEAHSGRITVKSEAGRGTRFTVALPARLVTAAAAVAPAAAGAAEGPRRILVIDDEDDVLQTLRDILGPGGHSVEIAASGEAALKLLAAEEFDLILSDLRMPGIDGPALYARLRQERPHLAERIAFITGDTLGAGVRRFLAETRRPCLEKPFTPAEIHALVRSLARAGSPTRLS